MENLVELLARHDPDRAARVRMRLSGPAPDGVLVLGPNVPAVGRLAMTLAGRLPGRLLCAPVELPVRESWVARSRAVVWVFHAETQATEQHWARLRELAGEVDEVHLVLAGSEQHRSWRAGMTSERLRLAQAVPRLGERPIHLLVDGHEGLVSALRANGSPDRRRNALRCLHTGLVELLHRREARYVHAGQRELATEEALCGRRARLGARRRDASGVWPRRVRANLSSVRLAASAELAEALRRFRDEASEYLERSDRADRAGFPGRFSAAAVRLADQLATRFDESLARVEQETCAELGIEPSAAPARDAPVHPRIVAPRRPMAAMLEERLMWLVGVSGGFGLGRLVLASQAAWPAALGAATVPLAVGLGVGLAWWCARAKRAVSDRARLNRWVAEVLVDLRSRLEANLSERAQRCEHRLAEVVDRAAATRVAELDGELREHELMAHRLAVRRTRRAAAEAELRSELRRACTELDRMLAGASAYEVAG